MGKFLSVVSEADGHGYVRWRYTLIEDRPLPRNSPEALVALWGVCVQIARERAWEKPRARMPNEALSWEFCNQLETLEQNVSIDRQNAGEPFQDIAGETREWLWRTRAPPECLCRRLVALQQIRRTRPSRRIQVVIGCTDKVGTGRSEEPCHRRCDIAASVRKTRTRPDTGRTKHSLGPERQSLRRRPVVVGEPPSGRIGARRRRDRRSDGNATTHAVASSQRERIPSTRKPELQRPGERRPVVLYSGGTNRR